MLNLVLVGVVAITFVTLWHRIRDWLVTTVADFVERAFGYQARKAVTRVVVTIDRAIVGGKRVVRKIAYVLTGTRSSTQDARNYKIVDYESEAEYSLEELEEMDRKGQLIEAFVSGGSA